jgi:hypothetical protein
LDASCQQTAASAAGTAAVLGQGEMGLTDRAKTGTIEGRLGRRLAQTTPPAVVTAGGGLKAESTIPRSNREALLDAILAYFKDNPAAE